VSKEDLRVEGKGFTLKDTTNQPGKFPAPKLRESVSSVQTDAPRRARMGVWAFNPLTTVFAGYPGMFTPRTHKTLAMKWNIWYNPNVMKLMQKDASSDNR
jgi:hypothetical protein